MALDLPEGWIQVALAEVSEKIVDGSHAPPPKQSDGLPMISARNVANGSISFDEIRLIGRDEFRKEDKRTRIRPNDVLLTIVGAVGRSAVVPPDSRPFTTQRSVAVISPNPVLPDFLSLQFRGPSMQEVFEDEARGTAQAGIYLKTLAKVPVLVPPLAEQKRIVTKVEGLLERVNEARERLDMALRIMKRFRQAVLAAACSGRLTEGWREENPDGSSRSDHGGDEDGLPSSWRRLPLKELCCGFKYGSSQKSDKEGKVAVLRMANIQNGEIDWTDLLYTSDEAEIEKYRLPPNSVLFNRTNSPELVGKTGIYRGDRPAIYAGYLIWIQHGSDLVPDYLNYCLNAADFKEYCSQVKSDAVSQSNINAKKLAEYSLPWCLVGEQHAIVCRVEALFALADAVEKRVAAAKARADKMAQSILAKAFRGELVPTEAELARQEGRSYEPASVLLERIRAEVEKAKPRTKKSQP